MFFRNNMPNTTKLKSGLINQDNCTAYCCQCAWVSVDSEEIDLSQVVNGCVGGLDRGSNVTSYQSKLPWICGGH